MSGRVQDKVVIVTGATSGIGRQSAITLAREGAKVVVTGRNSRRGQETVDYIKRENGESFFFSQDVTSESDWNSLVGETTNHWGRVDALVNNAGDCILDFIEDMPLETLRFMLRVNVEGCFLGMKSFWELLQKSGSGSIVNVSSVAGLKGGARGAAYGASKAAMSMMSMAAAAEALHYGDQVRVNSLHPGMIWGPGPEEKMGKVKARQFRDMIVGRTPLGRVGTAMDVSLAILYLVSDESRSVNGNEVVIDGGLLAH